MSSHAAIFVPVGHGALDEALVAPVVSVVVVGVVVVSLAEGPTLAAGILMRLGIALIFSHYHHIIARRPAA